MISLVKPISIEYNPSNSFIANSRQIVLKLCTNPNSNSIIFILNINSTKSGMEILG